MNLTNEYEVTSVEVTFEQSADDEIALSDVEVEIDDAPEDVILEVEEDLQFELEDKTYLITDEDWQDQVEEDIKTWAGSEDVEVSVNLV